MSYVNTQEGPRLVATSPKAKATILVLNSLETLDVAGDSRLKLGVGRQTFGVESVQNVTQSCYRKDARRELFGTLVRIILKIKKSIGELL